MGRCAVQCFDLDSLEAAGAKSPTVRGRGIKSRKDVKVQGAAACAYYCAQGEDDAEGCLVQVHPLIATTARPPWIEPLGDDEPPGVGRAEPKRGGIPHVVAQAAWL